MEPVTVNVESARKALGIGRSKIYDLINEGKIATVKHGNRRLVSVDSIRQFVNAA